MRIKLIIYFIILYTAVVMFFLTSCSVVMFFLTSVVNSFRSRSFLLFFVVASLLIVYLLFKQCTAT